MPKIEYVEVIQYLESRSNGLAINEDTDLFMSGILDSLGIIELINLISDRYSLEFSPEDLKADCFINLKNITKLIEMKQ